MFLYAKLLFKLVYNIGQLDVCHRYLLLSNLSAYKTNEQKDFPTSTLDGLNYFIISLFSAEVIISFEMSVQSCKHLLYNSLCLCVYL